MIELPCLLIKSYANVKVVKAAVQERRDAGATETLALETKSSEQVSWQCPSSSRKTYHTTREARMTEFLTINSTFCHSCSDLERASRIVKLCKHFISSISLYCHYRSIAVGLEQNFLQVSGTNYSFHLTLCRRSCKFSVVTTM